MTQSPEPVSEPKDRLQPDVIVQQPALPSYRVPFFELLEEVLVKSGMSLRVVYSSVPNLPNKLPNGVETYSSRTVSLGRIFWDSGQLYSSIKAKKVVVLSWNTRFLSLVPALSIARVRGLRTLLWGHGYSKQGSLWRKVLRLAVGRLAHAIVLYDSHTANDLRELLGSSCSVYCAPNALDQGPISRARSYWLDRPEALRAFRRANGLNGPTLLFVSRLKQSNRVSLLLFAAAQLIKDFPNLRVIVIGDGPAASELKALASRRLPDGCVTWVGACYDESNLAPWFLSSDIFVYPANAGLSVLHAFGYGLPVVTSDNLASQNPEVRAIEDCKNGVFYRDGDVEDLARQLGALLRDPDRLTRMGQAARRTATEQYNMSNMVDQFRAAIQDDNEKEAIQA